MTLLGIIQEFCRRTSLTVPQIVMASADDQLLQLAGLANEVGQDFIRRGPWQTLQRECVFTSVAGEDQGDIISITGDEGFLAVTNDTIYDRTRRLPVWGPRNPQEWQALKAMPMSGPFYQYRFRGNHLWMLPTMPAGHTMAFEYTSKAPVQAADGTFKVYFTKDTDTWLFTEELLIAGLRWRWKEEKGLPYVESFRIYESLVAQALGADGTKPPISMSGGSNAPRPGIFVPAGNWPVEN